VSPITRGPSTATHGAAPGLPAEDTADGRSTRWDDHREARRAELVQVARRLVHHVGPDVSMDDIAAAGGTSKSIVYRYFTDKQGLQVAVAEAVVADIRDALADAADAAATPREALRRMVSTYLAMIDSSPHVYTFVTRDGSVAHLVGSITGLLADPFAREVADQTRHSAEAVARAQVWAAGAVGFVRGAGERWLADRGDAVAEADRDADRETAAAQIAAWLWAGPIGVLGRERSASSTPPAPGRHRTSRVDDDAPTPGEQP
jgi:AcrR family transcriptional regulator